jgi:GNAT superfamily N-acetyltransferase
LTWQHTKDHTIVFPTIGTLQPQTLHGWLTLHWEKEAIIQFLSGPRESASSETTISTIEAVKYQSSSFQHSIVTTLHRCNTSAAAAATIATAGSSLRRLRLANSNDMDTVGRLVQGLADFEKEPDAVNVTPDHYRIDGFQSDPPLFYCLLLEVTTSKPTTISTEQDINTNDDTHDWYACGMAFCWIGARQDQLQDHHHRTRSNTSILPQQEALFLYLEDLFIEEAYRGNGAGTFVMTTLGEIALSLNCNKMVWQALDWNTPALTFYQNKIGAHIVDGLLTTRFAGRALHEFHAL